MSQTFYAHSFDGRPPTDWEPLKHHLHAVAHLAARFSGKFDAADWGHLAGLWHDVGKYRPEFQHRLRDRRIHAPHAGVGAALAAQGDSGLGLLLAFAIAGHHAGLANLEDSTVGPTPLKEVVRCNKDLLLRILPSIEGLIESAAVPTLPLCLHDRVRALDLPAGKRTLAFFTRMLFSALVDADRLRTREFYARTEGCQAEHEQLHYQPLVILRDRLDKFTDRKSEMATAEDPTPMNRLRACVLAACREAAAKRPGFYSLTVPTGGGKTLSGMSFALRHACKWKLDRVIVVIPFTSIIGPLSVRMPSGTQKHLPLMKTFPTTATSSSITAQSTRNNARRKTQNRNCGGRRQQKTGMHRSSLQQRCSSLNLSSAIIPRGAESCTGLREA